MIWQSHRIVTGISVFALSQSIVASCASVTGSVFPDVIDMIFPVRHRGFSHWFVPYLLLLIVDFYFIMNRYLIFSFWDYFRLFQVFEFSYSFRYLLGNLLFWFWVGSLFHIMEDSLTGYIPIKSPSDKTLIYHAFYTGSPKEKFFVLVFSVICGIIIFVRYFVFHSFSF